MCARIWRKTTVKEKVGEKKIGKSQTPHLPSWKTVDLSQPVCSVTPGCWWQWWLTVMWLIRYPCDSMHQVTPCGPLLDSLFVHWVRNKIHGEAGKKGFRGKQTAGWKRGGGTEEYLDQSEAQKTLLSTLTEETLNHFSVPPPLFFWDLLQSNTWQLSFKRGP